MSIPRYKVNTLWGWYGFVQDDEKGKFCEYRDYINLKSKFDCDADSHRLIMDSNRLNTSMWKNHVASLNKEIARLEAEVERLRKAGDDLCSTMEANGIHDNGDFEMHEKAIAQWNAAKEGKQS